MKYILVTGGVISGLGKGVAACSVGHLLQLKGREVTYVKMDPYLNVDAGLMSPYEHGECYVLDDGTEVDLDFGTAERFLDIRLSRANSITSGLVYKNVIDGERSGKYMGKTVQVVPHITDEILRQIDAASYSMAGRMEVPEICLIELGGTVGDIEGAAFLEALRQLRAKHKDDFCHIHVSLVPIINEQKSKPTQHSFKELRGAGLSPDFIFCRCKEPVEQSVRRKIADFCMVDYNRVVSVHDVDNIYKVPALLRSQNVPDAILQRLRLKPRIHESSRYDEVVTFDSTVRIAMVGKYTKLDDSYISVRKALLHACHENKVDLDLILIDSEDFKACELKDMDGVIVPGGFGVRGSEGIIEACKYARENNVPFLGICFGFQLAVIEFYRSRGMDVGTEEIPGSYDNAFVKQRMRKGLYDVHYSGNDPNDRLCLDKERFRNRYSYKFDYEKGRGINHVHPGFNMFSVKGDNPRILDAPVGFRLPGHPFYVGVQFHPEFLSRFGKPHPTFKNLVAFSKEHAGTKLLHCV